MLISGKLTVSPNVAQELGIFAASVHVVRVFKPEMVSDVVRRNNDFCLLVRGCPFCSDACSSIHFAYLCFYLSANSRPLALDSTWQILTPYLTHIEPHLGAFTSGNACENTTSSTYTSVPLINPTGIQV